MGRSPEFLVLLFLTTATFVCWVLAFPQQDFGNEDFNNQFPDSGSIKRAININPIMTEPCLGCLCQASTNCNLTTRCITNDLKYCGPFLISKPYWIDAGQLTLKLDEPSRDGAFISCATDPICSAQTVRTYMQRYQTDCDSDEIIDCMDMAKIHLMGQHDCTNPRVSATPFFTRFRKCYETVLELNAS